jgi:zinc transport system substrate-binding protein
MKPLRNRTWGAALVLLALVAGARGEEPTPPSVLEVGVTLHPYYSWTMNVVVSTPIAVRPVLPGDVDAGDYQPRPEDIRKLANLDVIIVNGLGHDDFITDMITASGNKRLRIIRPNDGVPPLTSARGGTINSHTFISFTNAITQTYAIAKALGEMRPALAATLQQNATDYARRLRSIKSKAADRLAGARVKRVVTVHDGYSYLMQEFGIEVAGVVEPAHGLIPSAKELTGIVDLIKGEKVPVIFSEEAFPAPLLEVLRDEGGARVYVISHIASGPYTKNKFEIEMQRNVDVMVQALVTDPAQ